MNTEKNQTTINTSFMLVNRSIVYEYFRLIKDKDINGLLSLFTDDAIIQEPFSNIVGGIQGKAAIRSFLEVAMMANSGLTHNIVMEAQVYSDYSNNNNDNDKPNKAHYNDNNDNNKITALVTFEKGDSIRAKFTFEIVPMLIQFNPMKMKTGA